VTSFGSPGLKIFIPVRLISQIENGKACFHAVVSSGEISRKKDSGVEFLKKII
jgi:hypothetical protein